MLSLHNFCKTTGNYYSSLNSFLWMTKIAISSPNQPVMNKAIRAASKAARANSRMPATSKIKILHWEAVGIITEQERWVMSRIQVIAVLRKIAEAVVRCTNSFFKTLILQPKAGGFLLQIIRKEFLGFLKPFCRNCFSFQSFRVCI
jgi:hypothetical protein